ncbi:hypothetical protein BDP27DRAFT_1326919 [Rhodocollybia butyracea]|uniref:DUF6533 domain-containing protein n=1 Tax=Rhodocollybia butyracea TaxID=206335 RepID=A0A9P5U787_9AGAR|nr:hypothetical protein BDP27DRAFT_1326919 [Rhodocollybia butyracea]
MSFDPPEELDLLNTEIWSQYVIFSATSVLVWDILIHFSDDIELLFLPRRFRPPTIVYFVSRYTFLAYSILQNFAEDSDGQCTPPKVMAVSTLGYIAVMMTLLQFFLRVKAIFCGNWFAIGFFASLWLIAAGGCSFLVIGAFGGICNSDYSFYIPVASILLHDSCVFVAISYRIFRMSVDFNTSQMWNLSGSSKEVQKRFLKIPTLWGKNLPSLSKAILREGQLYYLISLTAGILTLSLMLDQSLLPPQRLLLAPIHVVVLSVTTGHVFREVKLGRILEHEMSLAYQRESTIDNIGPLSFASAPGNQTDKSSVYDIRSTSSSLEQGEEDHFQRPAS